MNDGRALLITPCTKNKCLEFNPEELSVIPADYLEFEALINKLMAGRKIALESKGSQYNIASKQVYAFDLYVRGPRTHLYRNLRACGLTDAVRKALLEGRFAAEWFFLSGGYGVVHALELVNDYQATFSRQIALKEKIPYTKQIWENIPKILDGLIRKLKPAKIYVFGSADYIDFVLNTQAYCHRSQSFQINCGRASKKDLRRKLSCLIEEFLEQST